MRGLDVSSSTLMYRILLRLAAEGSAVLLFSPEIEDLLATCHRIGVLYAGELIEAGPSEYLDITTVGLMMTRGVLVAETGEAS
jgi:ABC-type uncharacterized transport system ATPase subunit